VKFWIIAALAIVGATVFGLSIEMVAPVHAWVLHVSGSDDVSGPEYGWWSGFGSVFPWSLDTLVALWLIVWHHYRTNNCHVKKCPRLGHYPVGQYKVCKKHHAEATGDEVTMEHLKAHHAWFHSC
jgi:hypothetical protein